MAKRPRKTKPTQGDQEAREAIQRTIARDRFASGMNARVLKILQELEEEVAQKLALFDPSDTSRRVQRLKKLQGEVREQITYRYDLAEKEATGELKELALNEARWKEASLGRTWNAAGVNVDMAIAPDAVLEALVSKPVVLGAVAADYWKSEGRELSAKFAREMQLGVAGGENLQQLIGRVRGSKANNSPGIMEISRRNAESIVRTSVNSIANEAHMTVMMQNSDIVEGVQHVSVLDTRTTPICHGRANLIWKLEDLSPVGENSLPFARPPLHWRCLPGDSLVAPCGDVTGVTKRWIDDEVVVIKTAANRELTCTPNHPVLTLRGWVAAGALDVSDSVICVSDGEGALGRVGDNQHMPAPIEEVFEAFFASRAMRPIPMPVAAPDFHGDGAASKVAIVGSDRMLGIDLDAPRNKPSPELLFDGADTLRSGDGDLALMVSGDRHAPCGDMTSAEHGRSALGRDVAPAPLHGFTSGQSDAGSLQRAVESPETDPQAVFNFCARNALAIEADNITSHVRRRFSGHVYNIETTEHFYVAQGVITHNCRSIMVSVLDLESPPPALDFNSYFKSLSEAEQHKAFGVGKSALFREGRISQKDLLTTTGRPLTLKELIDEHGAVGSPKKIDSLKTVLSKPDTKMDDILNHPDFVGAEREMLSIKPTLMADEPIPDGFFASRKYNTAVEKGFPVGTFSAGHKSTLKALRTRGESFAGEGGPLYHKRATIILGPPAAGKSTLAERLSKKTRSAIVDVDEAKPYIREYNKGIGANAVHEESTYLTKAAFDGAFKEGMNVILPKVGASPSSIAKTIAELKSQGYAVDIVNLYVDQDQAAKRMGYRFLSTGRLIPSDFYRSIGDRPRNTFRDMKGRKDVNSYAEVNANGAQGEEFITEGEGDVFSWLQELYQK